MERVESLHPLSRECLKGEGCLLLSLHVGPSYVMHGGLMVIKVLCIGIFSVLRCRTWKLDG